MISVIIDWMKLEEEADRFSVKYIFNKYGSEKYIINALTKIAIISKTLSFVEKDFKYAGFSLDFIFPIKSNKRKKKINNIGWLIKTFYSTGLIGYEHPTGKIRKRLITEYAMSIKE